MKRRVSQLIGLLLGSLFISACSVPAPNISQPAPLPPLEASPVPFDSAAWQVWPAAFAPQAVLDVASGEQFIWAATSFGVVRLDPATRAYSTFDQLGLIHRLLPIENGRVFAAGDNGLYYFDGQAWSHVALSTTQPGYLASINTLGVDVRGNLSLLASAGRNGYLFHYPGHVPPRNAAWLEMSPEGLPNPYVQSGCEEWSALATFTYAYRSLDECRRYTEAQHLLEQHSIYGPYTVDADGTFWSFYHEQLLHLAADGSTLAHWSVPSVTHLASDPKHGVWIATIDGLFFPTESALQRISIGLEKYTLYLPTSMAIDASGTVWAATSRGMQRLAADGGQWQLLNDATVDSSLSGLAVSNLVITPDGQIWTTRGSVLLRYDGHNFLPLPSLPSDPPCSLNTLNADRAGDLWAAGYGCGVLHFSPKTNQWQRHLPDQFVYQISIGTDDTIFAQTDNRLLISQVTDPAAWRLYAQLDSAKGDLQVIADNHGGAWVSSRLTGEVWHYQNGLQTNISTCCSIDKPAYGFRPMTRSSAMTVIPGKPQMRPRLASSPLWHMRLMVGCGLPVIVVLLYMIPGAIRHHDIQADGIRLPLLCKVKS